MKVCFYFQVHQPFRLRKYSLFDIGNKSNYFDEEKNKEIMEKVARKCYIPMNKLLLKLIRKHGKAFKIAFSISGTALEQFEKYAPDVIESFKELVNTGNVELLSETYYHSLAFLYDKQEFEEQVALHKSKMQELFSFTPTVFRNTELIFNNELAKYVSEMGYNAVLAEGADHILNGRSPNNLYKPVGSDIKLLLKNYKLSDDIAFRFSNKQWNHHPLSVEKFADWIKSSGGYTANLFMDYETFGEHQWEDTGIFEFMELLPGKLLSEGIEFVTPSELLNLPVVGELDVPRAISWADVERDLSAWLGNKMQIDAIDKLYQLKSQVFASENPKLIAAWKRMTTSDHFYYMCVKWFADGDVHKYFNPYENPYDGFITYMNVLNDLTLRIEEDTKNHWIKVGGKE